MVLKQNQTRLLKVVFKSLSERDVILQNRHKLMRRGAFVYKYLLLADCLKRRLAEKELYLRPDVVEKDLKVLDFRVIRLRQRMMPNPLSVHHEAIQMVFRSVIQVLEAVCTYRPYQAECTLYHREVTE